MKRFWKIFGITLGSLIAVIVIAALVAIYIVFTPERLTPIVRNVADQFITAEHEIGDVELTFFSTFPNAAVKVNGLLVINPMEEAQSDTVLCSPEVFADLDLMALLKGKLMVNGLKINQTQFNGFINEQGDANFNVLNLEPDTIEEDTSAFAMPFNQMKIEDVELDVKNLSFIIRDSLSADSATITDLVVAHTGKGLIKLSDAETAGNTGQANILIDVKDIDAQISPIHAVGNLNLTSLAQFDLDNMRFALQKANLCLSDADFNLDGEQYVSQETISLTADILAELNDNHYNVQNANLTYNKFALGIDADAVLCDNGDIRLNANADIQKWDIADLMALLPQSILAKMQGMKADGIASIKAKAKGVYNENSMPVIDASLLLTDGQFRYKALPFDLKQIDTELTAHLNMNDSTQSSANIKHLKATALDSHIDAFGIIDYLLADNMGADITARFDVNLPDMKSFMPQSMVVGGRGNGKVTFRGKIADVTDLKLDRTSIDGNVQIAKLDFSYDSLAAKSEKANLTFRIPNNRPSKNTVKFLKAHLDIQGLDFVQTGSLSAKIGTTQADIEISDILSNDPLLKANIKFNTDRLLAKTDSMKAELTMPDLKGYVVYNMKDSTAIPQLDTEFAIEDIDFYMDTIEAHIIEPRGKANIAASALNVKEPSIDARLSLGSADAKMGSMAHIRTDNLQLAAKANKNSQKENILLQWNPELNVQLSNGVIDYQGLTTQLLIPDIDFEYSNQDFNITEGKVIIGKSDFTLSGEVRNIGPWLDDTGDLRGELTLLSDYTDVPEIMMLTSGIGNEEESSQSAETSDSASEATSKDEGDPYMVPKGINLSLNTQINRALLPFINETAYDLGGGVYVRDGVLVIEEVGFICNAAKLQLTAMYETPRRNNLFVGLDYHMIDIDLERLVDMIPQVDTVLPMLRSFRGNAEFHLAAETYMNSKYEVKWSTTRGACSIAGHDLTLIDGQTFTTVAKLLNFKNKNAENQIDSISAEISLFRKEIDVYPFLMTMDKYKAAVGGRHNLDMTCDYHISLLAPTYLGVNIKGALDDIVDKPLKHIKIEKAKYARDFLPQYRGEVESQNQSLRQMIREALKQNMDE